MILGIVASSVDSGTPANELYEQDNAASTYIEVNSVGNWTTLGASIASSTTLPKEGAYCLLVTNTVIDFGSGRWQFAGVAGTSYTITLWTKVGVGSNQILRNWGNFTGFSNVDLSGDSIWTEHSLTLTATATATCEIRAYSGETGASIGDELYVDKITIIDNSI